MDYRGALGRGAGVQDRHATEWAAHRNPDQSPDKKRLMKAKARVEWANQKAASIGMQPLTEEQKRWAEEDCQHLFQSSGSDHSSIMGTSDDEGLEELLCDPVPFSADPPEWDR
jgi:hypothetical protein